MSTVESDVEIDITKPLTVTAEALVTVLEVRSSEDDPGSMALRVGITGANMTDFVYALELSPKVDAVDDDTVYTQGDHDELTVIVPADSITRMAGSVLDVPSTGGSGGLVIRNPNTPDPLDGMDIELTGELPEKVQQVLDRAINPALSSHGGFARLVDIEGTKVYVMMGGGCQGCAASALTLQDGIRKMLLGALPEITEVIDATDHSAGENPFYAEMPDSGSPTPGS